MPAKPAATKGENSVYKVIELVGTSDVSWDDAVAKIVEKAAKTLKELHELFTAKKAGEAKALLKKAFSQLGILAQPGRHGLNSDLFFHPCMVGFVNYPHPSFVKSFQDFVFSELFHSLIHSPFLIYPIS